MNIIKVWVYIICFILMGTQIVSASGIMYNMENIDDSKVSIELKWRDEQTNKGISITHFYLVNGKTLHIGYETGEKFSNKAYLEYNLVNAIPPIKVKLIDINNRDFLPFSDIEDIEAKDYILHLYDAGIVNGRGDGTFAPESLITRAEFMVLLVKALKLEGKAVNNVGFTDIEGHWARDIILIASEHGLISGYEDKTMRPDRPITLAEVSSVISRAFSFKTNRNGIYSKLNTGKWYSSSVKKMFDVGILDINDSIYKEFNEESFINRGKCATMISRALYTY
ncbi:UNVERIFIED_CONTAM: S-layer family protein [Acetivibrio alkalicellulosi]